MSTAYSAYPSDPQALFDEPPFGDVEILSLADEVSNAEQAERFLSRLDAAELRRRICTDWELGCVDAATTIRRLEDGGLLGTPEDFLRIYTAGVEALTREAYASPNDPPPDPLPEWRMLEALAEARKGRVG